MKITENKLRKLIRREILKEINITNFDSEEVLLNESLKSIVKSMTKNGATIAILMSMLNSVPAYAQSTDVKSSTESSISYTIPRTEVVSILENYFIEAGQEKVKIKLNKNGDIYVKIPGRTEKYLSDEDEKKIDKISDEDLTSSSAYRNGFIKVGTINNLKGIKASKLHRFVARTINLFALDHGEDDGEEQWAFNQGEMGGKYTRDDYILAINNLSIEEIKNLVRKELITLGDNIDMGTRGSFGEAWNRRRLFSQGVSDAKRLMRSDPEQEESILNNFKSIDHWKMYCGLDRANLLYVIIQG